LIQLLTELEYSTDLDAIARERTARQLALLVEAAGKFSAPYASPILDALLRKVTDPDPRVAAHVLDALGELCRVAPVNVYPMFEHLLHLVIDTLQGTDTLPPPDSPPLT